MNTSTMRSDPTGEVGPYRVVCLTKILDPATERRRCRVDRHTAVVKGVADYHSNIDIMSHLGTHVEAPSHHGENTKDITALRFDHFLARGVLLRLDNVQPRQLITRQQMDDADQGRVRADDVVILDSPYHSEPFAENPDDKRPLLSSECAQWCRDRDVKALGFGDGVDIENSPECCDCHDILLNNDILFIEVMKNLDLLKQDVFLISLMPLPIVGLDSSPSTVFAIEGVPGFTP